MMPIHPPIVYGYEAERHLCYHGGQTIAEAGDLSAIAGCPTNNLVYNPRNVADGFSKYNGGRHYVELPTDDIYSFDPDNVSPAYETSTPEVTSPYALSVYSRAMDGMAHAAIGSFVAKRPDVQSVFYNYRASFGPNNTYGAHLNYGISQQTADQMGYFSNYYGLNFFAHGVTTASFLIGGGSIETGGDMYFSQKVNALAGVRGRRGNQGTIFQLPEEMGVYDSAQRVEFRAGNMHPGEWASYVQTGIGAIILTIAQFDPSKLQSRFGDFPVEDALLTQARKYNSVKVMPDGTIRVSPQVMKAAGWVAKAAEAYLSVAEKQDSAMSIDLVTAANEAVGFCDDFCAVANGRGNVRDLASRATWAHRISYILDSMPQQKGSAVDFSTPECRAADADFDKVVVTNDGQTCVDYGPGFRTAEASEPWHVPEPEIALAMRQPPCDTRASIRVKLLRAGYDVGHVDWTGLVLRTTDGGETAIYMEDPLQTQLDSTQSAELSWSAKTVPSAR